MNYTIMSICADAGAQSDSEVSPHHPSEVSVDRGYTSDSEVYTEHSKTRIPRSLTDMDAASSGWLLVSTHTLIQYCGTTGAFFNFSLWLKNNFKKMCLLFCSIPVISLSLQVGKEELEANKASSFSFKPKQTHCLVNQYSLTVGQDLGQHDTKSLLKCVETLSFIVRDAAHVTPDNFELCVKAIRVFVEASLNGGESLEYNRT